MQPGYIGAVFAGAGLIRTGYFNVARSNEITRYVKAALLAQPRKMCSYNTSRINEKKEDRLKKHVDVTGSTCFYTSGPCSVVSPINVWWMVLMNLLLMVFMNLNIRNEYYISFVNNKPVGLMTMYIYVVFKCKISSALSDLI